MFEDGKKCLPQGTHSPYLIQAPDLFIFNLRDRSAPWYDVRVRQAVSLVADRDGIAAAARGGSPITTVGTYLPPAGPYALPKEELDKALGRDKPYAQRVADAKKLMADAGRASGFDVSILVRSAFSPARQSAEMIASQVAPLGIRATVKESEYAVYFDDLTAGRFQWGIDAIGGLLGLPEEMLAPLITNDGSNKSGYSNPELDALYAKLGPSSKDEQIKLSQTMERMAIKDLPFFVMYHINCVIVWWPHVKGMAGPNTHYWDYQLFENVWLDK